jgi:hypothetical protein
MEQPGQNDERNVDRGEVVREPLRQKDVRHRASLGAQRLGNLSKGAAESVRREEQGLAGNHAGSNGGSPVGTSSEPGPKHVRHAGLDGEPGKRVHRLDRHKRCTRFRNMGTYVAAHRSPGKSSRSGSSISGTRRPDRTVTSTPCCSPAPDWGMDIVAGARHATHATPKQPFLWPPLVGTPTREERGSQGTRRSTQRGLGVEADRGVDREKLGSRLTGHHRLVGLHPTGHDHGQSCEGPVLIEVQGVPAARRASPWTNLIEAIEGRSDYPERIQRRMSSSSP